MPGIAIALVIAGMLLLAWAGVEVDDAYHRYPGQFLAGLICLLIIAFAMAAARHRLMSTRTAPVLLRQVPALPPAVQGRAELAAAPAVKAIASPEDAEADDCEGPGCDEKVDRDPWTAQWPGEPDKHVFCSQGCAAAWGEGRKLAAGQE